jgi:hypothetical protein
VARGDWEHLRAVPTPGGRTRRPPAWRPCPMARAAPPAACTRAAAAAAPAASEVGITLDVVRGVNCAADMHSEGHQTEGCRGRSEPSWMRASAHGPRLLGQLACTDQMYLARGGAAAGWQAGIAHAKGARFADATQRAAKAAASV